MAMGASGSGSRVVMALLTALLVVGLIVAGGELFDGSAGRPSLADASTEFDAPSEPDTTETALAPIELDGSGTEIRVISIALVAISAAAGTMTILYWRHTGRLAERRVAGNGRD